MSMTNRPSRSGATAPWLDYLDALRDALLAASVQDELALRFEITIAENELVRRGLSPHALELPDRQPESLETFSPCPWASPEAQELFGRALVKTGRKYRDERSLRLGWGHLRAARAVLRESRSKPEKG
jgi:hypothetical protein